MSGVMKTATNITIGTGFCYALAHELDDILIKEPYFVPNIKKAIVNTQDSLKA